MFLAHHVLDTDYTDMNVPFGSSFRKEYFTLLEPDVVPVNNGSYGTTPTCVIEKQKKICEEQERYPDRNQYFDVYGAYKEEVKSLGDYLGLDYHNLALVANATTGVNTVLRSIPWNFSQDKVLFHSTSYGACSNTIKFLGTYYGLQYDVIELSYPLEDTDLLAKFEEKLSTNEYKLCMFDMITSMPGVKLPYEELTKLCKKYNTWSLLDGAHAAGQLDLTFLDRLQPDFMTTNLHKWLSAPKSCAMLYVNPKHHGMIQSLPVSWNFGAAACAPIENPATPEDKKHNEDVLLNKFYFIGTASYAQYFSVSDAIEFRSKVCGGEDNIRNYQIGLQDKAIDLILKKFGPKSLLLENSTNTLRSPGLFNVSIPLDSKFQPVLDKMALDFNYFRSVKQACDKKMIFENKAYAPYQYHNGKLWVRFSVQIFNELNDYEIAADSVQKVVDEVFATELEKIQL